MEFVKELHEARLIRTKDDLHFSYSEVCEHLYIAILALEFLSRLRKGKDLAKNYATKTASYINYTEFRTSATDMYNLIYFVQESPEFIEQIFASADAKILRQKTQLPRMELNRWLLKLDDPQSRDMYFFMRLEQALNISNSDTKDIRRMLSYKNPSDSDLRMIASRILNVFRSRLPMFDIKSELEAVLSDNKLQYTK
jgi:hypothetical protein